MFAVSGVVRGYHKYKDVWSTPIDGVELELGNPRNTSTVHVEIEQNPTTELTFGHVPRLFAGLTLNTKSCRFARECFNCACMDVTTQLELNRYKY